MITVRPEPVEGLCFDRLSTNELADKSGRINNGRPSIVRQARDQDERPVINLVYSLR
jgi:hypothetical protein